MNLGGYLVVGVLALLFAALVVAMWFSNRSRARRGSDRTVEEERAILAARPHGGSDVQIGGV